MIVLRGREKNGAGRGKGGLYNGAPLAPSTSNERKQERETEGRWAWVCVFSTHSSIFLNGRQTDRQQAGKTDLWISRSVSGCLPGLFTSPKTHSLYPLSVLFSLEGK